MTRTTSRWPAIYGSWVAVLVGIAATLGVFARGDGAYLDVVSVRGVAYEMATTGVYAYNAKPLVAEGVGWDVFTLALVVPAALATMFFVARGSARARLAAIGLFGYFLYMYLEYAVTWAFGPLFPLFVAICALSVVGITWYASTFVGDGQDAAVVNRFPRIPFLALNLTMAVLLTLMWSGRIATGLSGDAAGAGLFGETTLVVQALDLGLVVPVLLLTSIGVARRSPTGYLVGAAWAITALAMAGALVSMLTSSGIVSGEMPWPPMAIFGAFALGYGWVAARIYGSIRPRTESVDAAQPSEQRGTKWVDRRVSA